MDFGQLLAGGFLIFLVVITWSSITGSKRDADARQQAKVDEMRARFRAIPGHREMNEEVWADRYMKVLGAHTTGGMELVSLQPAEREAIIKEREARRDALMEAYKNIYGVDFER